MAIDTPARIIVLGAGPIGLEAGLYARYLGYEVEIYERGDVAEGVRHWGHEKMSGPFSSHSSTLGLAALAAQDANYRPPDAAAILTGREWVERYLLPLSQTDLLSDSLRLRTTAVGVTQRDIASPAAAEDEYTDDGDADSGDALPEPQLRVLVRGEDGSQLERLAHAVIDATGKPRNPEDRELALLGPHCHVLGAKTHPLSEPFPFLDGLAQIRSLFALLGGRQDLDLYATMKSPWRQSGAD